MGRLKLTTTLRTITVTGLLLALLSGCGSVRDWIKGRDSSGDEPSEMLGAPELEGYVSELGQIASGDPAAQAEIFADAVAAAQLTPNTSTNLRLGLILAIPGHPEFNPQEAQRLLRDVLSQTLLLTPAEVSLATIHLKSAEHQIVADAEIRRLRAQSSRSAQTQDQALNQRLTDAETENRRLQRDLDEAEQKLEAITSIERSIREQE